MARIAWIEDDDAAGEIADVYSALRQTSARGNVPDILRTMSLRPDFLRAIARSCATEGDSSFRLIVFIAEPSSLE